MTTWDGITYTWQVIAAAFQGLTIQGSFSVANLTSTQVWQTIGHAVESAQRLCAVAHAQAVLIGSSLDGTTVHYAFHCVVAAH